MIAAAGFLALLIAYWPALTGEFVFDDVHMQFASAHPERLVLRDWLAGSRPLTGFSYWINYQMGGTDTLGYHLTNLLLHYLAAWMVFLIVRKILEFAAVESRRATIISGFCAALFLLHPLQTEAVAYISSRSENLSVALAFGAWAVFLYRPSKAITLPMVAAVLLLCGAAVTGKEHVALLPLVLLLTDYYWNPGFSFAGIRRNWRLYGTLAVLAAIMGSLLYSYLSREQTVGFHMKEFTWYQYLFTQCRVLFIYLRLFLFPAGQNADYDIALSHSPLEHGAILGMAILIGATLAIFVWRKRFPIASFGFFVALIFFLPTSSIMPIRDLAAERRAYLPMIGLLLIVAEWLVRLRWNEKLLAGVLAGILAVAGVLTWNRSQVWAGSVALWSDAVAKSPQKARPHLGLAAADLSAHRSAEAAVQYELANRLDSHYDATFYANWAAALEGAGRHQEALEMGRKAVQMGPNASTYDALGRIVALNGDIPQALELLEKGEKSDPAYLPIYIDRADILMAVDRNTEACAAFRKARSLDPQNPSAARGLAALHCPGAY
jgi:tetratricopeptide (TPR) repeat protein